MRTLLHLVRKDLRRAAPGLLFWFLLQLAANVTLWLLKGEPAGSGLGNTMAFVLSSGLVLVNVVVSFQFGARLVAEDPPELERGTWRLLPLSPTSVFFSKCLSAALCSMLPTCAALLPVMLLHSVGPGLLLFSLSIASGINLAASLLGVGFSPLGFRHPASLLIQLVTVVLLLALGMNIMVRTLVQADEGIATTRMTLALLVLACGLPFSTWLYYRTARRSPALVALLLACGAACAVLAFWGDRTLELLQRSPRQLASAPLRTECTGTGAQRMTAVLGLPPTQWFEPFPYWLRRNASEGEMWLGNTREPALLGLHTTPRIFRDASVLTPARKSEPVPQSAALRFILPGKISDGVTGDLLPLLRRPELPRSISWDLLPVLPSLTPQVYVRPGFSAKIHGHIKERRIILEIPLKAGAVASRGVEQITLLRLQDKPGAPLQIELRRSYLAWDELRRDGFILDRQSGRFWPLASHSGVSSTPIGFVSTRTEQFSFSLPPDLQGESSLPAGLPSRIERLSYVELADVEVGRAFVTLAQEELREQIPAFSAEQVSHFDRIRGELEKRRKVRELRTQQKGR